MEIEIRRCTGPQVMEFLDAAARLRIAVFREYPYLYEGAEDSEEEYLHSYASSPRAVIVLAIAAGEVIGVSTGLPLADADEAFQRPFVEAGQDPAEWFYFGESVLDPAWRGRGVGHRFFDEREAHAAELGFRRAAFCSVVRSPDHPLQPAGYRPHDVFWRKRGFECRPEMRAQLSWRQIDSDGGEVANELVFWTRDLSD